MHMFTTNNNSAILVSMSNNEPTKYTHPEFQINHKYVVTDIDRCEEFPKVTIQDLTDDNTLIVTNLAYLLCSKGNYHIAVFCNHDVKIGDCVFIYKGLVEEIRENRRGNRYIQYRPIFEVAYTL